MARPVKFNVDDIIQAVNSYIDSTDQPFIQEFCLNYDISDEQLMRYRNSNDKLSGAIKKLLAKQELYLIREGAANKINPTMAIFRLKQPVFGYTDRQDVKVSGNVSFAGEAELTD
jgi:hypothetical protein